MRLIPPRAGAAGRFLLLVFTLALPATLSRAADRPEQDDPSEDSSPVTGTPVGPTLPDLPFRAGEPEDLGGRFSEFAFTSKHMMKRVGSFRKKEFLILGSIALGTIALAENKRDIQEDFQATRDKEQDSFFFQAKRLGDTGTVPLLGASLYLLGKSFRSPRVADTGFVILESALFTGLATEVGKFVLSEERPERGGGMDYFRSGGNGVSGHAAIAASVSGPLNRQFLTLRPEDSRGRKAWKCVGKVFAYGVPALTGLSRINEDRHYAWNVGLGLALGYSIGNAVANAHADFAGETPSQIRPDGVTSFASPEGEPGVLFRWEF